LQALRLCAIAIVDYDLAAIACEAQAGD